MNHNYHINEMSKKLHDLEKRLHAVEKSLFRIRPMSQEERQRAAEKKLANRSKK